MPTIAPAKPHVSIHAPARGATVAASGVVDRRYVSIHAPARGATQQAERHPRAACTCFNPRPRAGGDPETDDGQPARQLEFQSTPPRGGRLCTPNADRVLALFQSTPPRGGRPSACRLQYQMSCFNPRPRAGGDRPAGRRCGRSVCRFNPRPRAGGDCRSRCSDADSACSFNPRPRAGGDADRTSRPVRLPLSVSIHAPARGATRRGCTF